jgi:mycothiol synthase
VSTTAHTEARPVTDADFEPLAALLARDEEHTLGRPSKIGPSDLRAWLADSDPATDTWVVEEAGRPIAFGWHATHGEISVALGVVHPETRGRGLGSSLVDAGERRAREAGAKRLHYVVLGRDAAGLELLAAHGFREVRRFFEMAIELDGRPQSPAVPEGMTIETFREDEAEAFHRALEEAFQDHWEHQSRPWEAWWEQKRTAPDFDPTLWFLIRDGGEIAATARNDPNRNGGGWVAALGVRRAWRGKGLGKALLLHTFGEFHRRGVNRVSLGVDAENPTGATKLYESVGMTPEVEQVVFEKAFA